jgi:hypothetical protein
MSHIFISYSKRNKVYARRLADHLIASGFDVWIDDRIDYGSLWADVIQKAIEDCAAFTVIMTPEARESQWVKTECEYASQQRKRIFPLLLEGEVFFRFVSVQYATVTDGSLPPDSFLDELAEVAPRKPDPGADVTPSGTPEPPRPVPPRVRQPSSRLPLILGAGVLAAVVVIGLAFALIKLTGDDAKDKPSAHCELDWYFGNEHAHSGDCPVADMSEVDGYIQTFDNGLSIGTDIGDGRYFVMNNDGTYYDVVGAWDSSLYQMGECPLQASNGLSSLLSYENTPAEIIGCPTEDIQLEIVSYQFSDSTDKSVVYIGTPDEVYRLEAASAEHGGSGVWELVK